MTVIGMFHVFSGSPGVVVLRSVKPDEIPNKPDELDDARLLQFGEAEITLKGDVSEFCPSKSYFMALTDLETIMSVCEEEES